MASIPWFRNDSAVRIPASLSVLPLLIALLFGMPGTGQAENIKLHGLTYKVPTRFGRPVAFGNGIAAVSRLFIKITRSPTQGLKCAFGITLDHNLNGPVKLRIGSPLDHSISQSFEWKKGAGIYT